MEYIDSYLLSLETEGLTRHLKEFEFLENGFVIYQGKKMLNLSSSDYLGIAADIQKYKDFITSYTVSGHPLTASASRLLTGNHSSYEMLEKTIGSSYHKHALIYNSGYHVNTSVLPSLTKKSDLILSDKYVHASIIDGIKLSAATHYRFRHNDVNHLQELLEKHASNFQNVFIVVESVYSMDGDVCPLEAIIQLKKQYGAVLYLDEAHALGVFGEKGLGVAEQLNCISEVDIIIGTFGKALASVGAFIVTTASIRSFLINTSRSLIYSTALPPINVAWTVVTWQCMQESQLKRSQVMQLSVQLREAFKAVGIQTEGDSPIVPAIIGDNIRAIEAAKVMQDNGFLSFAIRPPTVPEGTARLRFSLGAAMDQSEILRIPTLLSSFAK